ncbi:MAG: SDR family oxidoreductase [Gemmobacter sp.]|nr:SDR family oxidoreductase [Gemmobacter sp.]
MTLPLQGKTAIVTGSARGLGRAYALRLARLGADVAIADLKLDGAADWGEALTAATVPDEVVSIGRRSLGVEADLSRPEGVARMTGAVMAAWGRIDIVVNNAGGAIARNSGPLGTETSQEDYDLLLDANLRSCVLMCQATAPVMKAQGSGVIVNVSSQTGVSPLPGGGLAVYGAAKAAVAMYTRALAAELGPHGIRVNAIAPGIIMTARVAAQAAARGLGTNAQAEALPLRRLGTVEDCAGVLEFLTTNLSQYVTGQIICADGGAVLHAH